MNNIKKFESHSDYIAFKNSNSYTKPNVSWCVEDQHVHYDKWSDPRIIATFEVETAGDTINIMYSSKVPANIFTDIEVDGVKMETMAKTYTFATAGEHTVKYTLIDGTTIPLSLFRSCPELKTVIIPSYVRTIGNTVFRDCTSLTSVTIPDSVTSLGNSMFNGCTSLTSLTIPDSVTSEILSSFCLSCESLSSLYIGENVTAIGNYAFSGCDSLTDVNIPDSVTSISEGAFMQTGLTTVTIGSGVTELSHMAFDVCLSLTTVTCKATTPPTLDDEIFSNSTITAIYVPAASVNAYKAAAYWSTYSAQITAIPS